MLRLVLAEAVGEDPGDVAEGAVLEQPGVEQVARLAEQVLELLALLAGSSRAALSSISVAATTRNRVAVSRSRSSMPGSRWARKSAVISARSTSVTSSLRREISCSSRSKGPSKTSRFTW